uniref:Uncharacterized protein n=1 Tax=Rangifer tarandus platyrhynchus TaxID=3082113 RepID=A0ACB0EJB7_RANTA|nr:unnamed protein product [Rangifer tarandus platyrhynchus]
MRAGWASQRCWLGDAALQASPGARELLVETWSLQRPPVRGCSSQLGADRPVSGGVQAEAVAVGPAWPGGPGHAGRVTCPLWSTWCPQVGWGGVLGAPGAAGPSVLWRWGDRRRPAGCTREECARLLLVKLLLPPLECWRRSCRGHHQERLAQGAEASSGSSHPGVRGPQWTSSRLLTPRGTGPSAGRQAAQGGQGAEVSAAGLRAAPGREPEVRFSVPPGVLPRGPQRRGRDCQPLACAGAAHGDPGVMGPSCGWASAQADWARSEAVQAGSGPGQAGGRGVAPCALPVGDKPGMPGSGTWVWCPWRLHPGYHFLPLGPSGGCRAGGHGDPAFLSGASGLGPGLGLAGAPGEAGGGPEVGVP